MKNKKRMMTFALAGVLLAAVSPLPASAETAAGMAVPIRVTSENTGGRELVVKVYDLPASEDPARLIEEPFERNGFVYAFESVTKEEKPYEESKTHSETITVSTASGDLAAVLGALAPTLSYDDGTYGGTLALDHTSIRTEAAGYETKNHTYRKQRRWKASTGTIPDTFPKPL